MTASFRIAAAAAAISLGAHLCPAKAQTAGWQPCGTGMCLAPGARAGIGTPAPDSPLTIALNSARLIAPEGGTLFHSGGADGIASQWLSDSFAAPGFLGFRRADHSGASPAALRAGDQIGTVGAFGFGSTAYSASPRSALTFLAGENWTDASQGAYAAFYVTQNGTASMREAMRLTGTGYLGIGTAAPQHMLSVNGTIGAKEVIVTNTGWADYVFAPGYRLPRLDEIASFVKEHRHLPDMPSEADIQANGVNLGDIEVKLLAKVEELTLHLVELERENRELRARVTKLESSAKVESNK